MIIQVHTPQGIVVLDTDINSDEDFATHGLTKSGCINSGILNGCTIRIYIQDTEPTLGDKKIAIWEDISVSGTPPVYLIYRRGEADQVSVELV